MPDPADAIAAFRLWRVETAVDAIAATTQAFARVVDHSVSGERAPSSSVRALVKAFVASFRALQEIQDGAKAASVISHDTSSAIDGVMKGIREAFEQGVVRLRVDVDRLLGRLDRDAPFPFGPSIAVAGMLVLLCGSDWLLQGMAAFAARLW